jgi:hypothetical protein
MSVTSTGGTASALAVGDAWTGAAAGSVAWRALAASTNITMHRISERSNMHFMVVASF